MPEGRGTTIAVPLAVARALALAVAVTVVPLAVVPLAVGVVPLAVAVLAVGGYRRSAPPGSVALGPQQEPHLGCGHDRPGREDSPTEPVGLRERHGAVDRVR